MKTEIVPRARESIWGVLPSSNPKGCVSRCIGSERMRLVRNIFVSPLGTRDDMSTPCRVESYTGPINAWLAKMAKNGLPLRNAAQLLENLCWRAVHYNL